MKKLWSLVLFFFLVPSGCVSIIATKENPRPMAGLQTYFETEKGYAYKPWESALLIVDFPLSALTDTFLLPYTLAVKQPEEVKDDDQ